MEHPEKVTPMVRQYNAIKARYPQYILMFRMGDFFEMFNEDAKIASEILGIALTKRPWGDGRDMPLAGVPYHAVDAYLAKFVRAGKKVAICDQTEDPKKAKGIVKREVVRIVTPGTILESDILDDKSHNFLVATCALEGRAPGEETWGLAVTDLSTGGFEITQFEGPSAARGVFSEIGRLQPAEALLPITLRKREGEWLDPTLGTAVTWLPKEDFDPASARRLLLDQFRVQSLEGYGAEGMHAAVAAAGALVRYLRETQLSALEPMQHPRVYNPSDYLILDFTTQRGLELVQAIHGGGKAATLLGVLDHTLTAMGARLLRGWTLQPLKDPAAIEARLDAVQAIFDDAPLRAALTTPLRRVQDLERVISRVGLRAALPRDLAALRQSLEQIPLLRDALAPFPEPDAAPQPNAAPAALLAEIRAGLDPHFDLQELLQRAIVDTPPATQRDGGVIREGFDPELDELRGISRNSRDWMEQMRQEEIRRTGINSLKIGYNKVFGFYIEVSKGGVASVPPDYIRKQTLTNGERYITPALKEKEEVFLNAQERILEIETRLFEDIRAACAARTRTVQSLAAALARLDCLCSLALAAIAGNFTRPRVDLGDTIEFRAGRHPVVEALQRDRPFVPNDVVMSGSKEQILLITGPNMAGKSTYIRQAALLTLMAQMGGFVPAASARVGVVDRIFTRVGAMDYLVRGQSTFLVEMSETANILNNATDRSLVILDEIGRGTSTYDGLSIAWAVVEFLHSTPGRRPKTLFATHYHELSDLEDELERVANLSTAVLEEGGDITFLYRIVPGGADHSYGIYAGKIAGLPRPVIERAKEILHQLEFGHAPRQQTVSLPADRHVKLKSETGAVQLSLFDGLEHPALESLRRLDVHNLTPVQALQTLDDLVKKAKMW